MACNWPRAGSTRHKRNAAHECRRGDLRFQEPSVLHLDEPKLTVLSGSFPSYAAEVVAVQIAARDSCFSLSRRTTATIGFSVNGNHRLANVAG